MLVEHGGLFGSSAAAPRAREVMRVALLKDPEIRARIENPTALPTLEPEEGEAEAPTPTEGELPTG